MTFALPTTGSNPRTTTKAALEALIDSAISAAGLASAIGWPYYADTNAGLAATTNGQGFITAVGQSIVLWQNQSGSAVSLAEVGTSLTAAQIDALLAAYQDAEDGTLAALAGAKTAESNAEGFATQAEVAQDVAETYAGVVSRATSVAGLTDPTTLTIGDDGLVSGSGDAAVDGLYEVEDDGGTNVWARVGDTGLAGKFEKATGDTLAQFTGLPVLATKVIPPAGSVTPSVTRAYSTVTGEQYEMVALFRAAELTHAQLICTAVNGAGINATFNTATQELVTAVGTCAVTAQGGGWYEMVARTGVIASDASAPYQFRPSPGGTFPYTANGTDGIFLASLVLRKVGSTVNLWPSSDPNDASFSKVTAGLGAATTSPNLLGTQVDTIAAQSDALDITINGRQIATRLTEGSGSIEARIFKSTGTLTSGANFAFEVWAKRGTRKRLNLYSNNAALIDATFDLGTGTVSGTGASMTYNGGEYYVCRVAGTVASGTGTNIQIRTLADTGTTFPRTGDGASTMAVYRAKFTQNGVTVFNDTNFSGWTQDGLVPTANAEIYGGIIVDLVPVASTAHPLSGLKVSIVGTSLVAQMTMPNAFAAETGAIVQALGASGGALGLDARGSPHYGSGEVTALFPSINSDAAAIMLDMCVNDIAASDVPLGAVGDTTTATYYGALANFFTWCEANRPNAAVCVVVPTAASPTYTTSDYRHGVANANGDMVEDFQIATRRAALYHGRPVIDPSAFGIGFHDMETGEATTDGLHWDASGAGKIAKIMGKQARDFCEAGWLVSA